ncbi:lipid II flippase MurJ [Sphingosinicella sp. LHD-64]|uniref:lipid II flippase MurJ n=1 Tax=Sphingosinicella sp. LHD-64 TaxID=3072139 RepID=UPI00280F05E6|nr:lipid II flippase MurJ [Sphingosinicella sp. LHD-64]MDQ8757233.1 lipid II flippase MurJ [Sphingosinicella sp. LHD-64]
MRLMIRARAMANGVRSEHKLILRDMTVIAGFILMAKIAAAAKEVVIASRFGTSPVVDAYLFVFNLYNLPIAVSYSVLTAVLIPLLIKLHSGPPSAEHRFRGEMLGGSILCGLGLGAAGWLSLKLLLTLSSVGLPPETRAFAIEAADYLALMIPLGLVTVYGSVLLMARGRHVNSLLEGAPALGVLVVLLVWGGTPQALLLGTMCGAAAHLLLTRLTLGGEFSHRPLFSFRSEQWRFFRSGVSIMLVAQLMFALTAVIDQFFAARLGAGAISTLGYAGRILSLFLSLGATSIGRAVLPVYSRVRTHQPQSLARLATQWTLLLFAAGLVVLVLGWFSAEWMVRLLFERGAFTAGDTAAVAEILRWGFLQLPFYIAMIAASQALFSASRYMLAAIMAAAGFAVKLVLNALLVDSFGLPGLMLATAAMYALTCLVLLALLRIEAAREPDQQGA